MVQVLVTYQGDLHCLAEHGPSAAQLTTDAPKDNEGKGKAFSPTDLVGTAMGTCMLTIMGIAARRHDWDLRGARVTVEKIMATEPVRRIARLVLVFEMPAGLDSRARSVLENAARLRMALQFSRRSGRSCAHAGSVSTTGAASGAARGRPEVGRNSRRMDSAASRVATARQPASAAGFERRRASS